MSGILEHTWGKSRAVDRVWAQVSGLAPAKAGRRLFMVLQAFIDESGKDDWFVLGGYIASAEAWAAFSKDWEQILPLGIRDKKGFHFHMHEMSWLPERMERVPAFYRVIENHAVAAISCSLNKKTLERARKRVSVQGAAIDWGFLKNPYQITFRLLMDMFHVNRERFIKHVPLSEKVDFYFDDQIGEKKSIIAAWDDYVRARLPEHKQFYGATPRFEDDTDFLPLQAADLWAWWVRKWEEDGTPERIFSPNFRRWEHRREGFPVIHITYNEEQLVADIIKIVREFVPRTRFIVDMKTFIQGERS